MGSSSAGRAAAEAAAWVCASLPHLRCCGASVVAQSVAGKGEAFISGLVPEEEDLAAYLAPLNWGLKRCV